MKAAVVGALIAGFFAIAAVLVQDRIADEPDSRPPAGGIGDPSPPTVVDEPTDGEKSPSPAPTEPDTTEPTESAGPPRTVAPVAPVRVPLSELCNYPGISVYNCGAGYGGTVKVGDGLFQYYGQNNGFSNTAPPNWDLILGLPGGNGCTKLVLEFAVDENSAEPYSVANIRIRRSGSAAVVAKQPSRGRVGRVTAALDGGPFVIEANSTGADGVFANGYAVCPAR